MLLGKDRERDSSERGGSVSQLQTKKQRKSEKSG